MKIIEEIKNQVEREMKKMIGKCIEKRYAKLTDDLKREFIIKVVKGGMTIRQASKDLSINYSSAKAIMANYRKSRQLELELSPKSNFVEIHSKSSYDWKKFKIQTYCQETQTNEYTMDLFALQLQQSRTNYKQISLSA